MEGVFVDDFGLGCLGGLCGLRDAMPWGLCGLGCFVLRAVGGELVPLSCILGSPGLSSSSGCG